MMPGYLLLIYLLQFRNLSSIILKTFIWRRRILECLVLYAMYYWVNYYILYTVKPRSMAILPKGPPRYFPTLNECIKWIVFQEVSACRYAMHACYTFFKSLWIHLEKGLVENVVSPTYCCEDKNFLRNSLPVQTYVSINSILVCVLWAIKIIFLSLDSR